MPNILDGLAAYAAAVILGTAARRQKPVERSREELLEIAAAERAAAARRNARLARAVYPNNAPGNYAGRREPKPLGKPLTPAQRFAELAAAYLSSPFASRRRSPRSPGVKGPGWFVGSGRRAVYVQARTKSEARGVAKWAMGVPTTRGLDVVAAA